LQQQQPQHGLLAQPVHLQQMAALCIAQRAATAITVLPTAIDFWPKADAD